ncbi:MAG: hypothetical protein GX892_13420 [Thermoanaerobacteraceae bacterium]|nr:hypothetical protein [Thermoanaerobacteraceae bacterium]
MTCLRKNLALLLVLTLFLTQAHFNLPEAYAFEAPQNGTFQEIIESTYPLNNQAQVEVKPTLKLVFKFPVEILDKAKISLKTGDERYDLDQIYLLQDQKTLCIDVGRNGKHPLRRNTLYRLSVLKGAVKLKDYDITNDDIIISFITSGDGKSPQILGYSSSLSGSDNITSLSGTRLSPEGSIYIRFDRDIKWEKNTDKQKLLEGTKLYRIPKPTETAYDQTGNIYDKAFEFEPGLTEAQLKEEYWQEIDVEDIEIINNNTVRIKPKGLLLNLNQYRLIVNKELIEDIYGYALENDVDFYFWTVSSSEKPKFNWEHIEGTPPGSIKDSSTGDKTCTIIGTWAYGPDNPFVFLIEGEAIPKAGDISSLKKITLAEGYKPESTIKISKVRFEYNIEGSVKKTKLFIYPEKTLDAGKYYVLTVSGDVIQNRSGQFLPKIDMYFTVGGDTTKPAGICEIEPNTFEPSDIYEGKAAFTIKGYNFNEEIEYISLKAISGESAGTVQTAVYKKDIEFKSITELDVKIRDPKVISDLLAGDGEYLVELFFKNRPSVLNESVTFKVLPRGKPKVIATDPQGGDTWSNERRLNARTIDGTTRYFLKVTFDDFDGSLRFDTDIGLNLLQSSTVYSEGQNEVSMIDTEFITFIQNIEDSELRNSYISQYIFVKDRHAGQAHLYVPVKPLRSQTTYIAMINAGIVYFAGAESSSGNDPIQWTFTTTANPTVSSIQVGSVIEDYDEDVPIILYGDFFDEQNIEVYFNDVRASRVRIGTSENGQSFLRVYLPSGRNRLKPGIYTIMVRNDRDHEFEVFGALSVVREGSHIPNEEYRVKDELRIGEVISDLFVSEDILILDRRYTDRRSLEIDLDEIMGQQVLTRKIRFDGRRADRISTLETLSKWADITLYDIGIDDYSSDEKAEIALGRAEPLMIQNLKQKLGRQIVKSEFIQVTKQNVRFSSFRITMPFKESDGEDLKVLRYDPYSRQFIEEDFRVDKIEKTVTVDSNNSGIFVVVEQ